MYLSTADSEEIMRARKPVNKSYWPDSTKEITGLLELHLVISMQSKYEGREPAQSRLTF